MFTYGTCFQNTSLSVDTIRSGRLPENGSSLEFLKAAGIAQSQSLGNFGGREEGSDRGEFLPGGPYSC